MGLSRVNALQKRFTIQPESQPCGSYAHIGTGGESHMSGSNFQQVTVCYVSFAGDTNGQQRRVLTFTVDFTFFLSQSCRLQTLPTLGTSEAVFVPGLEETAVLGRLRGLLPLV